MIHSSIHAQEEHELTWNCWSMMACCSLCSRLLGLLMLTDRRHACSWWRGREQSVLTVVKYVVCERGCERERCGVQGKAVKEWRWLWWLCGWMEVAVAISWVRWLSRPAAVLPLPPPQVSLLGAQYAWTPVASSCVISGSLFTSQNFI